MNKEEKNKYLKKYIKGFWIIFFAPFIFLFLLFFSINVGLFGSMPSFEELENTRSNLASEIYSSDSVLLGTYYREYRTNINYEDLSPNVVNALLSAEDIRFHNHSGVDIRSVFRVLIRNLIGGQRGAGGGSTLSQQLAKNLFPRQHDPSALQIVIIKFKEWVTAIKLERNYTKEELIAMYLNTVDFGSHSFGIKAASKTFFNTQLDSLRTEESAMLVGLLKAPSWYHPVRNPERALRRRNTVLHQMMRYGYINQHEYDSLRATPVDMSEFRIHDQHAGMATYFREYLRNELVKWSKTRTKPDGENYNIYKDGLKIYTTIDSRKQMHAEEAIKEHLGEYLQPTFFNHWEGHANAPFGRDICDSITNRLYALAIRRSDRYRNMKRDGLSEDSIMKSFNMPVNMKVFSWDGDIDTVMTPMDSINYYKHFLNTGLMSVEPYTGYVRAYVGGIDLKHFKYDHVTLSRRQVGSTFKPFLYTLAMQEGESPCMKVPNSPVTFILPNGDEWTPRNASDDREGEMVTLKWGLAHSVNYISAFLMKRYNPQVLINLVRRMGIKSHIDPVPSIVLGTPNLSVYEMTGAMSTYVNEGIYIEPTFVTHITDNNGNLIESFVPYQEEAMSEQTAYLMLELLKNTIDQGTGIRLRIRYDFTNPIAGKTGTTQRNSDGWFVGIVPDLVTGIWVGGEDRAARFRSLRLGQGANTALPIWAKYTKRLYEDENIDISKDDFKRPSEPLSVETDCSEYEHKSDIEDFDDVFSPDAF